MAPPFDRDPSAPPVVPRSPAAATSLPTRSASRSPQPRVKHPARRARLVVAGAATAATVGLIGGFAVAAPAATTGPDAPANSKLPGVGGIGQSVPPSTSSTPTTSGVRSPARSAATPSTTVPAAATPIAPATPSNRTPSQPHARSRAS